MNWETPCMWRHAQQWINSNRDIGESFQGGIDGFLLKINPTGDTLLNSTFVGTSAYDQAYLVQVDKNGKPYVYGQSSGGWTVSSGVYANPNSGQFITRYSADLSTIERSTVFGSGRNKPDISPSAFLV
jgi:hypothetical protein